MLNVYPYRDLCPSFIAVLSLLGTVFYSNSLEYGALLIMVVFIWMRIWVRTWVGKHTRAKVLSVPKLVVEGPFGWSRNPLYLANLGTCLSLLLFLGLPGWWVLVSISLLWLNWHLTILQEEIYLSEKFSNYQDYLQRVPRYFSLSLRLGYGDQSPLCAFVEDRWTWTWQGGMIALGLFLDMVLR